MNQLGTMTARQVEAASEAIFRLMSHKLCDLTSYGIGAYQLQQALEQALAEQFAPNGGVLLIWWDPENGLRCNPASYASNGSPQRKGRMVRRDMGRDEG